MGRRGSVKYPPHCLDITRLDFFLWTTKKQNVRPSTRKGEKNGEMLLNVRRSLSSHCQRYIDVDGGHFERS